MEISTFDVLDTSGLQPRVKYLAASGSLGDSQIEGFYCSHIM